MASKIKLLHLLRNTGYALRVSYCAFLFVLAACAPTPAPTPFIAPSSPRNTVTPEVSVSFSSPIPPTLPPSATAPATNEPEPGETPLPSPTPACTDSLKFIADVNYLDGSLVSPGQSIEKQWRVENNGTCDWDARYHLKLLDGFPPLGANAELALYPARAGTPAVLTVNFTAPFEAGTYLTSWQAAGPDGALFGEPIYMEIVVGQ